MFRLKLRLQQVDEELCKAQQEMYRDRALQKRYCKTAEDLEFFESSEDDYRERLEQIKLQKKDNRKKLKAVERCLERDGSLAEAELELQIPVGDMEDMADVEKDEVPGNPYRVQEIVVVAESITEPVTESVEDDEIVSEVGITAETVVTGVKAVANAVITDIESTVETDIDVMAVNVEYGLQNDDIREYGETVKLPSDKADYMRMSAAEKVHCYPFDIKGTDSAFEMVKAYFVNCGAKHRF